MVVFRNGRKSGFKPTLFNLKNNTMKRFFLTAAVILAVCLASIGNTIVAQGESNSEFGAYKIEAMKDKMLFMDKQLDKYQITYANSDLKVIVAVDKLKKGEKYYVLNEKFPVQYERNGTHFGIKVLDKAFASQGYSTIFENANRGEYFHQKVLTTESIDANKQLHLIAAYYPGLLNI
jgi:hypothetical protein